MTLYTIAYVLKGCGTQASQSVLSSSIESAMKMFKKANPGALITHVSVGVRVVMYEEVDE